MREILAEGKAEEAKQLEGHLISKEEVRKNFEEVDKAETKRILEFKEQLQSVKKPKDTYAEIMAEYNSQMSGIMALEKERVESTKELIQMAKENGEVMKSLANTLTRYLEFAMTPK